MLVMQAPDIIPHLFRSEFRKITAVLCKAFSFDHIGMAEDIASETFLAAMETWPYKGLPENPTAWLYTVARNKARNRITRDRLFRRQITPQIQGQAAEIHEPEIDLSPQNITDSQLQMLFAICNPVLPAGAQIGLALRLLCGFGIDEIATAFLSNKETISKRLYRAKEKLRTAGVEIAFPSAAETAERLPRVLTTLYLLFSEGYYSESDDTVLREELCLEALRLTRMLLEPESTRQPEVYALLALMCFQASRFPARKDSAGKLIFYHDQDPALWNQELISSGFRYQRQAATGSRLSRYHIEAAIAGWYTLPYDTSEKWESILYLYNQLLALEYSPIAALNRAYALFKVKGNATAIEALEQLRLTGNHYYYTLLGELYRQTDIPKALECWHQALALARSAADRTVISEKIRLLCAPSASRR